MIGPTDLSHTSPAPHFKTSQVFLIYSPKCPNFNNKRGYDPTNWRKLGRGL